MITNLDFLKVETKDLLDTFYKKNLILTYCQTLAFQKYQSNSNASEDRGLLGEIFNGELLTFCFYTITKSRKGKFLEVLHGPVFSNSFSNNDKIKSLKLYLKELIKIAKSSKSDCIRINTLEEISEFGLGLDTVKLFESEKWKKTPFENFFNNTTVLNIKNKAIEDIFANYNKTMRNTIRRNQEMLESGDLEVKWFSNLPDECKQTYDYLLSRSTSPLPSFKKIQDKINFFTGLVDTDTKSKVLCLYYNGQCVSFLTFLVTSGNKYVANLQACFDFNSSYPSKYNATIFMHHLAIQKFKSEGIEAYDFWGTAPKDNLNHPWYGFSKLKWDFKGDNITRVWGYDYPLNPVKYQLIKFLEKRSIKKRGY
jgi:FemAB family